MNAPFIGFTSGGERQTANVRNDSASVSIPLGTPVTLSLDGTEDGLAVILPSAAADQATADKFFFGVVKDTIAPNSIGPVQLFGVCRDAILRRATRAGSATSDNWAGSTSIAKGVLLSLDTVNNCFSTAVGSTAVPTTDAVTVENTRFPFAFLAQSINSFASTDSVATSNGSALTVLAKVFVRSL